ncbi:MAG TPA: lamin tail domain-containing protein [bacterium]|nr:lamin tail domain-containing protein [bacterium]
MKIMAVLIFVFLTACSIEPPQEREYLPFLIEKFPEERKYYPEETMVFVFNMEILEETSGHFKATGIESETVLETRFEANRIFVLPPLPHNDELYIVIGSGLKSVDHKPLFIDTETPSKTGNIEILYEVGGKTPELVTVLPEINYSATIVLSFDGEVDLDKAEIEPVPEEVFVIDAWAVLSYDAPVKKITVKNAISSERESVMDDITVILEGGNPEKKELEIDYSTTDVSYSINISDESALAVDVDGIRKICEKKCSVTIEGLKPATGYNSEITVFTTTGRKKEKTVVETDSERPKIMITEIMHTPSKEPEKSWEFVEIYNYGNLDFDLNDCFVDDNNNSKGIDPLLLRNENDELILRPGDIAVITGNEAAFGDLIGSALWLVTKDTTIADGGLTSKETVQIKCNRDGIMFTEADEDPKKFSTARGYSFTVDLEGNFCASSVEDGTPGRVEKCPETEGSLCSY